MATSYGLNIEPRPYQRRLIDKIVENPDKNYLIWLTLGSGKTLIPIHSYHIKRMIGETKEDPKMLVVVPRIPLVNQWVRMIKENTDQYKVFMSSGESHDPALAFAARQRRTDMDSLFKEYIEGADIIVTTPLSFTNELARIEKKHHGFTNEFLNNVDTAVLDEATNVIAKSLDKRDMILGFRKSEGYRDLVNLLNSAADEKSRKPQVLGLTGMVQVVDLIALESNLGSTTLTVDSKEIYDYISKPPEHVVRIDAPVISEISDTLSKIRQRAIKVLQKETTLDTRSHLFYKALTEDLIHMNPDLLFGIENGTVDDVLAARAISANAKTVLAVDVLKLNLFSAVGYYQFKQELDRMGSSDNFLRLQDSDIRSVASIVDGHLNEPTPKLEALMSLIDSDDVFYSGLDIQVDGAVKNVDTARAPKLVFTRLIDSALTMRRYFSAKGVNASAVAGALTKKDSITPILDSFRGGKISVLVSTDRYLQEGIDMPGAVVIDFDYSSSHGLREQRINRGRGADTYTFVYTGTPEEKRLGQYRENLEALTRRAQFV